MKQLKRTVLSLFALTALYSSVVLADEAAVRKSLTESMPSIKIDSVKPSEVKGLYEVTIGANIFYVSDDGKYMLQGHLIDVKERKDLTESKLTGTRKLSLDKLGKNKMIIFSPKDIKHKVTVFTDIDCGYCRKLHSEMDQYLAKGISVQYLFFPRAGKGSESYDKAVSVWCADDRNAALTSAKNGKGLKTKSCENPIDEHMKLATEFEVRGTPMIVTDKGNVFPGYVPADRLAQALQSE